MIKVSIIIAILNSHEIVRRQILHFEKMNLPEDVEILFVDDGSDPPLTIPDGCKLKNFSIYPTNDFRPWTQPIARNKGVAQAKGEYVLCTDIDHILTRGLVEYVYHTAYDVVQFQREVGILDGNGDFSQNVEELVRWGFNRDRLERKGFHIVPHGNSYAMRRALYLEYGGGREERVTTYPSQEEVPLRGKIRRESQRGNIKVDPFRPTIYMFPVGRYIGDIDANPFGLFHDLSRTEYLNKFKRVHKHRSGGKEDPERAAERRRKGLTNKDIRRMFAGNK